MGKITKAIPKNGFTPLKLEHILLFILGILLLFFAKRLYHQINSVGQVIILIIYLGLLVGIAPLPMPVFKSKFWQTVFAGVISGFLDSYIVLEQCKHLRTVEEGQNEEKVMEQTEDQRTEGIRAKLMALFMMAALIGGLIIWFGEVYAAGLYNNDGRTGVLSALYVMPPVLLFLSILGLHAKRLPIKVVPNKARTASRRDLLEFIAGVAALLVFHNPLLCLAGLLVYSVLSRQDDHLLDVWKFQTEVNVMLVLLIALVAGTWLVETIISPLGLNRGEFLPIIPAGIQAVLWGPLYMDDTVHFWIRIATLSTGALLLPISSLVGVMLFKNVRQWFLYIRYSIPYAILWYVTLRTWIWLTLETPIGHFLDRWAHNGGPHH